MSINKDKTKERVILSDAEFTAEVKNRAKKVKAAKKKSVVAILGSCMALIIITFGVLTGLPGGGNKADFSPGNNIGKDESAGKGDSTGGVIKIGYGDYVIIDGTSRSLSLFQSERIDELVKAASAENDGGVEKEEFSLDDYLFGVVIGGIKYFIFADGVLTGNRVIYKEGLGERLYSIVRK